MMRRTYCRESNTWITKFGAIKRFVFQLYAHARSQIHLLLRGTKHLFIYLGANPLETRVLITNSGFQISFTVERPHY